MKKAFLRKWKLEPNEDNKRVQTVRKSLIKAFNKNTAKIALEEMLKTFNIFKILNLNNLKKLKTKICKNNEDSLKT